MRKILYGLFGCFGFVSVFSQTQTGPGGVGTSTNLKVWLDASQLSLSDGDPVATWADISGNGNDFTQGVGANQPSYSEVGLINNLPAVSFNGTSDFVSSGAIAALNTDVLSYFIVYRNVSGLSPNQFAMVLSTRSSANNIEWAYQLKRENFTTVAAERYARQSTSAFSIASSGLNNTEALASTVVNGIWRGSNNIYGRFNGAKTATATGAVSSSFNHTFTNLGAALDGSDAPIRFFEGDIAEVVVFNTEINSAQEKIIYNHLAAKYNITLVGSSIYNYNATYPSEMAGIGRDDASNEHLTAKGTSIVEITAASLDDNDYLLWGHDAGGFTPTTINIPASYVGTGVRYPQEWRFTEDGETGDVTLTFDVTGNSLGPVTTDYELLIDADGNFTDAVAISGTYLADIVTFTVTAAQINDGDYFTLGNSSGGSSIISIVDGQDWSTPSTWSCTCIPDNGFSVVIDDGHTVTVSGDETVHSLTVNATGELVIDANAGLSLTSDMNVLGTFTSNSLSSLNFNGNSFQTIDIPGSIDIDNCEVDNPAGMIFNTGTYSFYGVLSPTDGDIDFNGNDITFVSDASGTAVIGIVGAGASMSGTSNIKVQRFIAAGAAGSRSLGTPLTSMDLREWDDEVFISGTGFPDGCAMSSNGCYHSARYWRSDLQNYRTVNDLDSALLNGFGIEMFLGDNLNTFSATTLTSAGVPNMALSVDIPVVNQWNFIANPFLSPIDFDDITRNDAINTGNYFYVYDPSISGFQYWNGDAGVSSVSNLDDGILASHQGFWVFHDGASSTITIDQSSKKVSEGDDFLKSSNGFNNQSVMTLELKGQNPREKALGMLNFINQEKSRKERLPKINVNGLSAMSVYTSDLEGNDWVVNELLNSNDCFELPVYVDVLRGGEYSVTFENIYPGYEVYAINNDTKKATKIVGGSAVSFEIEEGEIERQNPITLSFKKKEACLTDFENNTFNVLVSSENISISSLRAREQDVVVNVFNTIGTQVIQQVRMAKETASIMINTGRLSGMYLVSITDLNGQVLKVEKVFLSK